MLLIAPEGIEIEKSDALRVTRTFSAISIAFVEWLRVTSYELHLFIVS
ncbi:MAG: hypothetical protein PWQ65_710 [Bacteroidota bacterium]|nr:hypothetical protein [Bacteroidota bacterium]